MKGRIRFVPGTNCYAYAAACPFLVSYSLSSAFLHIIRPFFIPIIDYLFTEADPCPGAITGTLSTSGTKILKPEIYGLIRGKGKIRGNHCCLKPRTQEGIEHDIADTTNLPQTGPE